MSWEAWIEAGVAAVFLVGIIGGVAFAAWEWWRN